MRIIFEGGRPRAAFRYPTQLYTHTLEPFVIPGVGSMSSSHRCSSFGFEWALVHAVRFTLVCVSVCVRIFVRYRILKYKGIYIDAVQMVKLALTATYRPSLLSHPSHAIYTHVAEFKPQPESNTKRKP